MQAVFSIGDRQVLSDELYPLLAQYQLLPRLAQDMLIDQAIAEIECSPEECASALQHFTQQFQIETEDQRAAWLKHNGMTTGHLEQLATRSLKLEKYKQATWGAKIEAHFLERKGQLDRVVYSLIRTQDTGVAQELFFRIQEGESTFTELAKDYSQGSEAQTGGLIGPVEIRVPHPKIGQMLRTSQPGQLLPPTRVGEWMVIVRLEKYITAQLDAAMRKRLLDEQFQSWLQEAYQESVAFHSLESPPVPLPASAES